MEDVLDRLEQGLHPDHYKDWPLPDNFEDPARRQWAHHTLTGGWCEDPNRGPPPIVTAAAIYM